jgi:hypothetical protein
MNALRGFRPNLRRMVSWAATWALAVMFVEHLALAPSQVLRFGHLFLELLFWEATTWFLSGCLYVALSDAAERLSSTRARVTGWILWLGVWLVNAVAQPVLLSGLTTATHLQQLAGDIGLVHASSDWLALALYNFWVSLFYGGLLTAAYALTLRAERTRSLLHASSMTRSRTDALLDAVRLQAMESQIDPILLLDSMQDLQLRYRSDPQAADRLLEALVEFLRCAMQGLRDRVSTVDGELRLARAYSHLQQERGIDAVWRVCEQSAPPLPAAQFPSLLMLPLLALAGKDSRPLLRAGTQGGRIILSLHGLAQAIPHELRQQLSSRLGSLYGDSFSVDCPPEPRSHLAITLGPAPAI